MMNRGTWTMSVGDFACETEGCANVSLCLLSQHMVVVVRWRVRGLPIMFREVFGFSVGDLERGWHSLDPAEGTTFEGLDGDERSEEGWREEVC